MCYVSDDWQMIFQHNPEVFKLSLGTRDGIEFILVAGMRPCGKPGTTDVARLCVIPRKGNILLRSIGYQFVPEHMVPRSSQLHFRRLILPDDGYDGDMWYTYTAYRLLEGSANFLESLGLMREFKSGSLLAALREGLIPADLGIRASWNPNMPISKGEASIALRHDGLRSATSNLMKRLDPAFKGTVLDHLDGHELLDLFFEDNQPLGVGNPQVKAPLPVVYVDQMVPSLALDPHRDGDILSALHKEIKSVHHGLTVALLMLGAHHATDLAGIQFSAENRSDPLGSRATQSWARIRVDLSPRIGIGNVDAKAAFGVYVRMFRTFAACESMAVFGSFPKMDISVALRGIKIHGGYDPWMILEPLALWLSLQLVSGTRV
jgi:hypothetical protein